MILGLFSSNVVEPGGGGWDFRGDLLFVSNSRTKDFVSTLEAFPDVSALQFSSVGVCSDENGEYKLSVEAFSEDEQGTESFGSMFIDFDELLSNFSF